MHCDKNMLMVKAIEKYPCLYNFNLFDYLRKDVTDEAWNNVASQSQLSVAECKEKWKNLRYGLLRSLRPNAAGTVKKKYYLHDEMEFVLPFIKTSKHDAVTNPIEETGIEVNVTEQDTERMPNQFVVLENSEPPKKKSRSNESPTKSQLNSTCNNYTDVDEDSRKMFLLSLLPEINALTEFQMRAFRRKVFALIDEIADGPAEYDPMCLLDWQKDKESGSQDYENSQNDIIKKERL